MSNNDCTIIRDGLALCMYAFGEGLRANNDFSLEGRAKAGIVFFSIIPVGVIEGIARFSLGGVAFCFKRCLPEKTFDAITYAAIDGGTYSLAAALLSFKALYVNVLSTEPFIF